MSQDDVSARTERFMIRRSYALTRRDLHWTRDQFHEALTLWLRSDPETRTRSGIQERIRGTRSRLRSLLDRLAQLHELAAEDTQLLEQARRDADRLLDASP